MLPEDAVRHVGYHVTTRGKGTFAVGTPSADTNGKFLLVTGAPKVVKIDRGFVVCLGLDRAQVEQLRVELSLALSESDQKSDASEPQSDPERPPEID